LPVELPWARCYPEDVFRLASALVVLCLLAQVMVTERAAVPCAGCDPAAAADESRHNHPALQNGCCCGSDGAPCAPDCDECVCCPHQRPMTLQASMATPILDRFDVDYARPVDPVERAHADEILHIPKFLPFV
jgi:hypothetical protein